MHFSMILQRPTSCRQGEGRAAAPPIRFSLPAPPIPFFGDQPFTPGVSLLGCGRGTMRKPAPRPCLCSQEDQYARSQTAVLSRAPARFCRAVGTGRVDHVAELDTVNIRGQATRPQGAGQTVEVEAQGRNAHAPGFLCLALKGLGSRV